MALPTNTVTNFFNTKNRSRRKSRKCRPSTLEKNGRHFLMLAFGILNAIMIKSLNLNIIYSIA